MKDKIGAIVTVLTIVGMAFGIYFFLDANYAKCQDVKAIERRLDYKIESDKLSTSQDRLWKLEDRYGVDASYATDPTVRQHMKELRTTVDEQRDRVRRLEGK
jgi:hypothetical protein